MKIAELFAEIKLEGGNKTVQQLGKVKTAAVGISSAVLASVAAIAGMTWAIKKLGAASNAEGTALRNFGTLTGISTKALQQYQYATRKAGGTNEEMTASFLGLQKAMLSLRFGEGDQQGMADIFSQVGLPEGGIKNTLGMMEKLAEYAKKTKDTPEKVQKYLSSFGLGDNVIAGMLRGGYDQGILNQAPYYTGSQIASLDKARDAWQEIDDMISRSTGEFNADHLSKMIPDIKELVVELFKLFESMTEWLIKFDSIGKISKTVKVMSSAMGGAASNTSGNLTSGGGGFLGSLLPSSWPTSATTNTVNFNQTINDTGLTPQDVGRESGDAIQKAFGAVGK